MFRFLIWGGDGEDDEAPQGEDQNNDGTVDDASSDSSGNGDSGNGADENSGDGADDGPDLETQLDATKRENIRLKTQLENAKEKREDKTKNESKEKADLDKLRAQNAKMSALMETSYLETAILKESKYKWHSVDDVRTFINKSSIRLDLDSGKIEGLDLELKRIAKEKPYLLALSADSAPNGEQGGSGRPPQGSGQHPFGGQTRQRQTDKTALGKKYRLPGYGT